MTSAEHHTPTTSATMATDLSERDNDGNNDALLAKALKLFSRIDEDYRTIDSESSSSQIPGKDIILELVRAGVSEREIRYCTLSWLEPNTNAGITALDILMRMAEDYRAACGKWASPPLPDLRFVMELVQAEMSELDIRRIAWPLDYEERLKPTFIRLLDVSDDLDALGRISCTVNRVDLDSNPVYTALSYTWGDCGVKPELELFPEILHEPVDDEFEISCNGQSLWVTRNCYTFLLALREARRKIKLLRDANSAEAAAHKEVMQKISIRPLWIDAICINQKDQEEQSAQVRLMHRVYSQAQQVFVWLGPSDETSSEALGIIAQLSRVNFNKARRYFGSRLDDEDVYHALALPYITTGQWLAIAALCTRKWFSRSWIIQEVALSRETYCFCGSRITTYQCLSYAVLILEFLGWRLQVQRLGFLGGMPAPCDDSINTNVLAQARGGGGLRFLPFTESILNLHFVGLIPHLKDGGVRTLGGKQPNPELPFQALLYATRHALCFKPVDRIYSLLGLMHDSLRKSIPVDYTMKTEHVFIETTLALITSTKSLSILSHVEKKVDRVITDLPSWVPDYSAPRVGRPIDWGGREGILTPPYAGSIFFCASQGLPLTFDMLDTSVGAIQLQGIYYDTIRDHVPFIIDDLLIYEPLMDVIEHLPPGVVWRTLLADEQILKLKQDSPYFDSSRPARATAVDEWFLSRFFDVLIENKVGATLPENDGMVVQEDGGQDSKEGTREHYIKCKIARAEAIPLAVQSRIGDHLDDGYLEPGSKVISALVARMQDRELFTTSCGRFGATPSQPQINDEIWVIGGANVPYVLRPNGERQYTFVSEAYMHGIMYGELIQDKQQLLQKITLV